MNLEASYKTYWPSKEGDTITIEGVDYIMIEFARNYSINYPYPVLEWIPVNDYLNEAKFEEIKKLVEKNKYEGVYTKGIC